MTCHRRFTFTFLGGGDYEQVLRGLQEACKQHWWFTAPQVAGQGLNVLQAHVEVAAPDQWKAYQRAVTLMERIMWPRAVPTPAWEKLPPHGNRGRYRMTQ